VSDSSRASSGRRLSRRKAIREAAAFGLAAAAARALDAGVPPARAQESGKLTACMFLEPNSLDPAAATYIPGIVVLKNVVETLIELDQQGRPHPRLATSWQVSQDGREWTFRLREGITFHDGTPFNAEAVKFSFDRILDPATKSQTGLSEIGTYQSSQVVDSKTIKMIFKEPYAPFFNNLQDIVLGVVSPAAVKKYGADFGSNPVGTGPYRFQEWVHGDHVTLVRNDKYVNTSALVAHKTLPYLDTLVFRIITEDQTRLNALRSGEADFIYRVPGINVDGVQADSRFQVFKNMYAGDPVMFLINRSKFPTDDLAVARAMEFAVNKEVVTRIATGGISPVAYGPLKPVVWGYDPEVEKLYRYDPPKARQVLEEAGWKLGTGGIRTKNGQACKAVCAVKSDPVTVSMLTAIQGMFRAVGIDLEIQTMALPASEELARQGKSNMTFMEWRGIDPDILTVHYHSKNIGGWNMGHFSNPTLDSLLDRGRAIVNPKERLPLYQKAQMLIMEQAATLPLYNFIAVDGGKATLTGMRYDVYRYYPEWYDVRFKA
jgi:peptide/nickel transport system substrate-binding protein